MGYKFFQADVWTYCYLHAKPRSKITRSTHEDGTRMDSLCPVVVVVITAAANNSDKIKIQYNINIVVLYDCETCVLSKGIDKGWYTDYELVGDNPAVRTWFQICISFCLPLADPQGLHALTTFRGSQTFVISSALTSSCTACSSWSMHTVCALATYLIKVIICYQFCI